MHLAVVNQRFILSKAERRGILMLAITMSFALVLKSLPSRPGPPVILYTNSDSGLVKVDTLIPVRDLPPQSIPSSTTPSVHNNRPAPVDVNRADSTQLQTLHGIGPVLASRIVRYRNRLGGFIHLNQLFEVYGIDSQILTKNEGQILFTPLVYDSLKINSASFKELLSHPYLNYDDTKRLMNYRRQHGAFSSEHDLKQVHGLTAPVQRLLPYLSYGL